MEIHDAPGRIETQLIKFTGHSGSKKAHTWPPKSIVPSQIPAFFLPARTSRRVCRAMKTRKAFNFRHFYTSEPDHGKQSRNQS